MKGEYGSKSYITNDWLVAPPTRCLDEHVRVGYKFLIQNCRAGTKSVSLVRRHHVPRFVKAREGIRILSWRLHRTYLGWTTPSPQGKQFSHSGTGPKSSNQNIISRPAFPARVVGVWARRVEKADLGDVARLFGV